MYFYSFFTTTQKYWYTNFGQGQLAKWHQWMEFWQVQSKEQICFWDSI